MSVSMWPVMGRGLPPQWSGATWIGVIDDAEIPSGRMALHQALGYARARFLVRHGMVTRGFVDLALAGDGVDGHELAAAVAALPIAGPAPTPPMPTGITVVLCTRDRPELLAQALKSLLHVDYANFEVVVVDNGPASGLTRPVVESLADPRVRIVDAPVAGLARARNIGLLDAAHDVVAFTDDDVVVDRWWLQAIAGAFEEDSRVGCVTGMVPSGELISASQAYFDQRVNWASSCQREVFSLRHRPVGEVLFPFQVGRFGTGANFAVSRNVVVGLGGFDEALGIGSPTGGGEDIDMFVRVLLAGNSLVYEPSSIVWHRHRSDPEGLERQIRDYGRGLGAWIAKLAVKPPTARMMIARSIPGLRHVRTMTRVTPPADSPSAAARRLCRLERVAILLGPLSLLKARRLGARERPLTGLVASRPRMEVSP